MKESNTYGKNRKSEKKEEKIISQDFDLNLPLGWQRHV